MVQVSQPTAYMTYPRGAVVIERTTGEHFYSPMRPPCSLYVLLDGRVSVTRLTREGKRLVTDVLKADDVFGDLSFCKVGSDKEFAEALTDCRALAVDSRRAKALIASHPELTIRLLTGVANRLYAACDRLEEFAYSPVETRIASALLRIAGHSGRMVPVSHQFLAEMAGTYRETATRALEVFQVREMLQLGRCAIEIRNPQGLAEVASS